MAKRIIKSVVGLAGGVVGSVIGGKLFGGKDKVAAAAAPGPIVMPLADDEAVKAARKRSLLSQSQRGGRNSTILTDTSSGSSTLGG